MQFQQEISAAVQEIRGMKDVMMVRIGSRLEGLQAARYKQLSSVTEGETTSLLSSLQTATPAC